MISGTEKDLYLPCNSAAFMAHLAYFSEALLVLLKHNALHGLGSTILHMVLSQQADNSYTAFTLRAYHGSSR